MRVLITGAAGFLGRHVVRAVAERGHEVRVLVRSRQQADVFPRSIEVACGDLRHRSTTTQLVKGVDAIIHLAAAVRGNDETQFANTVVGTENLLAAADSAGIEKLVLCSSFAVYDWKHCDYTLDEECPLETNFYARDGYAIAKLWQERLVRRFADTHGRKVVILRPGFIWGKENLLLAGTGHSFGRLHVVFGGQRELPISYVENCAESFALALEKPAAMGQALNIVDDERVSAWQYMGRAMQMIGIKGRRIYIPYWLGMVAAQTATWFGRLVFGRSAKLPGLLVPIRYQARFRPLRFSNRKAKHLLDWQPRYTFNEAWDRIQGTDHTHSSARDSDLPIRAVSQEAVRGS